MEKVAVITDIHGNLPALEAALARVEEIGPDAVYANDYNDPSFLNSGDADVSVVDVVAE